MKECWSRHHYKILYIVCVHLIKQTISLPLIFFFTDSLVLQESLSFLLANLSSKSETPSREVLEELLELLL